MLKDDEGLPYTVYTYSRKCCLVAKPDDSWSQREEAVSTVKTVCPCLRWDIGFLPTTPRRASREVDDELLRKYHLTRNIPGIGARAA